MAVSNDRSESSEKKLRRMQNKMNKIKAFLSLTKNTVCRDEPPSVDVSEGTPDSGIDVSRPKKHKRDIPSDELEHLRARLRAQQKEKLSRPLLFQTSVPSVIDPSAVRQLIMYALEGGNAQGIKPTWCSVVRWLKISQIVVVSLDGLTKDDFDEYSVVCPHPKLFLDIHGPLEPQESGDMARNLLEYTLSKRGLAKFSSAERTKRMQDGSLKPAYRIYQEISRCVGSIHTSMDGLTRLHLLMSVERMALEKYPVPSYSRGIDISYFVPTCDMYAPVTETSPLFAVDCEMCMTATNKSELTRISIVDEHMQVVYDTYVKPYNPITNYLTKYSGITKAILDPVKTRLHDVQEAIRKLLPADAILCGQSLNGDLQAMEMTHPYVVDTSVIYNLNGNPRAKTSLKNLALMFLSRNIQGSQKKGHDSVEDSRATMELVVLKLKNGGAFGDVTRGWQRAIENGPLSQEQPELPSPVLSDDVLGVVEPIKFPMKRKELEKPALAAKFTVDTPQTWCSYSQSLLKSAERAKKSFYVAGDSEYVEQLSSNEGDVEYYPSSKTVLAKASEKLNDKNFVFADVRLKRSEVVEKQKAHIVSMMRRVSRLFARALDRSLCILVLSGDPGQDRNGLCCAGIKTLQVTLTDGSNSETFSDPD